MNMSPVNCHNFIIIIIIQIEQQWKSNFCWVAAIVFAALFGCLKITFTPSVLNCRTSLIHIYPTADIMSGPIVEEDDQRTLSVMER